MGQSQGEIGRVGEEREERGGRGEGAQASSVRLREIRGKARNCEGETQTEGREERAVTVVLSHSAALH